MRFWTSIKATVNEFPLCLVQVQKNNPAEFSFNVTRRFFVILLDPSSLFYIICWTVIYSARSVQRTLFDSQISPDMSTISIWVPNFLKGILDLIRRISSWYGRRWRSGMGHGKFIVKKHLNTWTKSEGWAKGKIQNVCAFPARWTGVISLCYCARNAALNSEIAGPGWQRLWMSLQRRKERHHSETRKEKIKKRGRKKKGEEMLVFWYGWHEEEQKDCFEIFSCYLL